MRLVVCLLISVLFFSFASAENQDEFRIRSLKVFKGIEANFLLPPQGVELEFRDVNGGSAEAQKNLLGYFIALDYAELENASNFELEGMFAHELSHIESYKSKSFFSMLIYGIHYQISSGFRKQVERETDMKAIEHGFAIQLYEFRKYRLRTASEKDRKILEKYYMSTEEINMLIPANSS